jgi:hypothetical protein
MKRTLGWLDSAGIGDLLFDLVCEQTYNQARLCRNVINAVAGPNPENLEPVRFDPE